jgi:Tol biopolymer transport system component/tRNA A-37 threonylcarbamoyl transferase component Bud32
MHEVFDRLKAALADRYTIEREVGSGGMATVYLAQDLKHDRKVALKVMRPELAAVLGGERFLREIRIAAKLNHPHILALYDSGEADGFLYYVMPHVEGESLRSKLTREKQLPMDEAITLTRQVASALDHAHQQGVIHRDIKPENILIHQGEALVADFGIALAVTAAGGTRLTDTGLSLGTPEYMSPEQATGERGLDARSDVYSLGAVVYEMLVGEPPHIGNTVQAIIAKVVSAEPQPVSRVRHSVPSNVDAAVMCALAKTPADRLASGSEFADALTDPAFSLPQGRADAALPAGNRLRRFAWTWWVPWAVAGAAVVLALVASFDMPAAPTVRRSVMLPGLDAPHSMPWAMSLDISPDGGAITYSGSEGGLYLNRLDELEAHPLPGTDGAFAPRFSPDGQEVAYAESGTGIRKIPLAGGPPFTVTDSAYFHAIDWGDDGFIYFTHKDGTLARIHGDGGRIERLTVLNSETAQAHRSPESLPGGRGVVFTITRWPAFRNDIAVLDLETRQVRVLQRGVSVRYAGSGHLVFARADGTMLAVPFDHKRLEVTGAPVPLQRVLGGKFALSDAGTLFYWTGSGQRGLTLVDRTGRGEWLGPQTAQARNPRFSPEGQRIALTMPHSNGIDVRVLSLVDSTLSRITFEGDNIYPSWSADGRYVMFATAAVGFAGGNWRFYQKSADGSGELQRVFEKNSSQVEILQSRDGRWLVYREGDVARGGNTSIYYVEAGDSGEHRTFVATPFNERSPAISPDGRWLAYISNETGRNEVYVRPFPGPGSRQQISSVGGREPVWAHSGRELFYRSAGYLIAADVQTTPSFSVLNRRRLFPTEIYETEDSHGAYDVLPGDQQFVFVAAPAKERELVMVLNWFEELKAKVGN